MALIRRENPNRLGQEKSPYLLQHAYNPVDWFPWGDEAFEKARRENKPVFLSIGYSTCHWCHVMARESFEDEAVAQALNNAFVSIKVDREERPDIDNIYMRVCQTLTGGGGWPTSIFMSAEQKPFFAGTYFPKAHFLVLLNAIREKWAENPSVLLNQGQRIAEVLHSPEHFSQPPHAAPIDAAVAALERTFDSEFGGFGNAPKFPTPHILLLLLKTAPRMAEKTLLQMYRGGIFDHIGFGFSRYSTDRFWLVPHFEKMLYDNALLATAYLTAFELTGSEVFRSVAEKTLTYLCRELESPGGGFFSAQDADSDGEEGKFYSFTPDELTALLGEADGRRFNEHFGITPDGNFEGRSIPNLLGADEPDPSVDELLPRVYEYRRTRTALRTDHKILTAWNALALAAFADAYRILGNREYLDAALRTANFIEQELTEGNTLLSGITEGTRGGPGFLDDYAFYIHALIRLHQATQDGAFAERAREFQLKAISDYFDRESGGFFFSGAGNEKLLFNPKETYDGAIPSGNSVMAYNLTRLRVLADAEAFQSALEKQEAFMNAASAGYPPGSAFYLYSMLPVKEIVCALKNRSDLDSIKIKSDWIFRAVDDGSRPLLNGETTFYVCGEGACLPPSNQLPE